MTGPRRNDQIGVAVSPPRRRLTTGMVRQYRWEVGASVAVLRLLDNRCDAGPTANLESRGLSLDDTAGCRHRHARANRAPAPARAWGIVSVGSGATPAPA